MEAKALSGNEIETLQNEYELGRKAGIGEVVAWLKERGYGRKLDGNLGIGHSHLVVDWDEWQAKLKEWGIK